MMRFADELADLGDFHVPAEGEIRRGRAEDGAAADRQPAARSGSPDKHTDEYMENLMRVIQAKVKGKRPKLVSRGPHAETGGSR